MGFYRDNGEGARIWVIGDSEDGPQISRNEYDVARIPYINRKFDQIQYAEGGSGGASPFFGLRPDPLGRPGWAAGFVRQYDGGPLNPGEVLGTGDTAGEVLQPVSGEQMAANAGGTWFDRAIGSIIKSVVIGVSTAGIWNGITAPAAPIDVPTVDAGVPPVDFAPPHSVTPLDVTAPPEVTAPSEVPDIPNVRTFNSPEVFKTPDPFGPPAPFDDPQLLQTPAETVADIPNFNPPPTNFATPTGITLPTTPSASTLTEMFKKPDPFGPPTKSDLFKTPAETVADIPNINRPVPTFDTPTGITLPTIPTGPTLDTLLTSTVKTLTTAATGLAKALTPTKPAGVTPTTSSTGGITSGSNLAATLGTPGAAAKTAATATPGISAPVVIALAGVATFAAYKFFR